jgi:hypothetical protein
MEHAAGFDDNAKVLIWNLISVSELYRGNTLPVVTLTQRVDKRKINYWRQVAVGKERASGAGTISGILNFIRSIMWDVSLYTESIDLFLSQYMEE